MGTEAFAASSTSVRTPTVFPAARATFDAPMFPDPTVRTSFPVVSRVSTSPNGTEPSRYAPTTKSAFMGMPARAARQRRTRTSSLGSCRMGYHEEGPVCEQCDEACDNQGARRS